MQKLPRLYIVLLMIALLVVACQEPEEPISSSNLPIDDSIDAVQPVDPTQTGPLTADVGATNTPAPTTSSISVRLTEVQLISGGLENQTLYLNNVSLIPLSASGKNADAVFQYVQEGDVVPLRYDSPYIPTTDWYTAIDRDALAEENFGMWFVFSGTFSPDTPPATVDYLKYHALELAPYAIPTLLVWATPGLPDEFVLAYPLLSETIIKEMNNVEAGDVRSITEPLKESIYQQQYLSDAFVFFTPEEDYLINHQLSVVSNDGSLRFVFTVVEMGGIASSKEESAGEITVEASAKTEVVLDQPTCGSIVMEEITSGVLVEVKGNRVAFELPTISGESLFSLRDREIVRTILPYCDEKSETLWWSIRSDQGQVGWIPQRLDNVDLLVTP